MKAEGEVGDDAEDREHRQPAQVQRDHRHAAALEPAQQDRESRPEQERERRPRLLLDEDVDAPADQVLDPADLEAHLLVEVHQDHAEEREAAEHVERLQPLARLHGARGRPHFFSSTTIRWMVVVPMFSAQCVSGSRYTVSPAV